MNTDSKKNKTSKEEKKFIYAKDAFLSNPVASATDFTGYVQGMPVGEFEAASYEEMFDVPVSYKKDDKFKN